MFRTGFQRRGHRGHRAEPEIAVLIEPFAAAFSVIVYVLSCLLMILKRMTAARLSGLVRSGFSAHSVCSVLNSLYCTNSARIVAG